MRYSEKTYYSNPGNPIHVIYSPIVDKNGNVELKATGKENTDDIIQSYAESCDIKNILKRVGEGNLDLLNQRVGQYGDFTKLPNTLAEALQMQINSKMLFESLPVEVKQKFDNDSNKFFAQSGNEEWFEKMKGVLPENLMQGYVPPKMDDEDKVNES